MFVRAGDFGLLLLAILPPLTACVAADQMRTPHEAAEPSAVAQHQEQAQDPDEILVKFVEGISPEQVKQINAAIGVAVVKEIGFLRTYVVRVPANMTTSELIAKFAAMPVIEYAEPNHPVKLR